MKLMIPFDNIKNENLENELYNFGWFQINIKVQTIFDHFKNTVYCY